MEEQRWGYSADHPLFDHPSRETVLWRYLDFTKFVSLIENQKLFFSRADLLGDRWEGSISPLTLELREATIEEATRAVTSAEAAQRVRESFAHLSAFRQQQSGWTFISCWHMSKDESAAMWAQYLSAGQGVAIRTTYERLTSSLPQYPGDSVGVQGVYAGMIRYIDYQREVVPESNSYAPYLYKRKSFEHERELRLIATDWSSDDLPAEQRWAKPGPPGVSIATDLGTLIAGVHLAPGTPTWIADVVKAQLRRAWLPDDVTVSELDADPLF